MTMNNFILMPRRRGLGKSYQKNRFRSKMTFQAQDNPTHPPNTPEIQTTVENGKNLPDPNAISK